MDVLKKIDPKYSDIPDTHYINDFRKITDFKKNTFNGYQKSDVLSALQKSILEQKLEEACHWGVEMLVSGHLMECWDRLILINSKLINHANPNLSFHIWIRFSQIIQIIQDPKYHGEKILQLRNNQECRNHLTDIVSLMTLSPKNKLSSLPKISTEDFRIDVFQDKLEAKHIFLIQKIIKENDPSEINVVVNEFAFQLTERTGNIDKALYWLNWIMEWEKLNVKKAEGFNCGIRNRKYIKPQYYHDIIWLIWDVIFQEASFRNNEQLNIQLIGLFKLFKYNFTSPGKRRKVPLIIHAIHLISYQDTIKWDMSITLQSKLYIQALANTNLLYLEYKKKGLTSYQKKEEGLQVLTRNNYLVSDQKISASASNMSNSARKQNANKVTPDVNQQMSIVNAIDKMIINKNAVQQPMQYNHNLISHSNPTYKDTEKALLQIQSLIS
jgi:hypothetical protein